MLNEEWNKAQNDAPFVAFYDIHAVMFVLPDEMSDVSIEGFTGQAIPTPNPTYIEKKYRIWNKNHPTCCNPTN